MKYSLFLGAVLLLTAGEYAAAQPRDSLANYPMTRAERALMEISKLNDLKQAYDTLKTDYARGSFIHVLPAYFPSKGIKSLPGWANSAIVDGLASNDARLINESVLAAGVFSIPCGDRLAAIYKEAPLKYGHHSERIRTSIIHALRKIHDPNNSKFFNDLLTNGRSFFLSDQFEELLRGIDENRNASFSPKLAQCANQLSSLQAKLSKTKNPGSDLELVRKILGEVIALQNRIAQDQAAINGGSK